MRSKFNFSLFPPLLYFSSHPSWVNGSTLVLRRGSVSIYGLSSVSLGPGSLLGPLDFITKNFQSPPSLQLLQFFCELRDGQIWAGLQETFWLFSLQSPHQQKRGKKITMWELWVVLFETNENCSFIWGQNENCSLGDSIPERSEKLFQTAPKR